MTGPGTADAFGEFGPFLVDVQRSDEGDAAVLIRIRSDEPGPLWSFWGEGGPLDVVRDAPKWVASPDRGLTIGLHGQALLGDFAALFRHVADQLEAEGH